MSATIDSQLFAQYFSLPVRGVLEPAPVMTVQGQSFTVSEYYLEDLHPLGDVCHSLRVSGMGSRVY